MGARWQSAAQVLGLAAFVALCSFGELAAQESRLRLADNTVHVNGVDLFYRIGGTGPPLLLLHGFSGTGHDWDTFLDEFGRHYTVIVPDLRGHGRSNNPAIEFSYQQAARELFGLLDHLGIKKVKGIGFSGGGCAILHMAAQEPERLEAMILVAAAHRLAPEAREMARTIPRLEDLSEFEQQYYRRVHPRGEPQIRSLLSQLRAFAHNYEDFDFSPEHLSAIPVRTFLVFGDRDEWYPIEVAVQLYEALPNATLWVIPGQGHDAILKEWGGSELAADLFPRLALEFLADEGTE